MLGTHQTVFNFQYHNFPIMRTKEYCSNKLLSEKMCLATRNNYDFFYAFCIRLSEHSEQNKMGLNNLATVFGPNILRPSASSRTDPQDLAQGTLDVMSQVSIFLWFVKFCSLQLPADPELRHRLHPRRGSDVSHSQEFSEYEGRLI